MKSSLHFDVSAEDRRLIVQIADRAERFLLGHADHHWRLGTVMDLTACHANGCRLRLKALLDASPFNLMHDIAGIREHLDRKTGKLDGRFRPRFAERNWS